MVDPPTLETPTPSNDEAQASKLPVLSGFREPVRAGTLLLFDVSGKRNVRRDFERVRRGTRTRIEQVTYVLEARAFEHRIPWASRTLVLVMCMMTAGSGILLHQEMPNGKRPRDQMHGFSL